MYLSNLKLLKQFNLLSSKDYFQIKDVIGQYLCPHQFEVCNDESLEVKLSGFSFGQVALFELSYNAPVQISFGAECQSYLFRFNLEGECKVKYDHSTYQQRPGLLTVSHPHFENRIELQAKCRNIILKIDHELINTVLYRLLGYIPQKNLIFDSGISYTSEERISILETLNYLCFAYSNIENWWQISDSFSSYLTELLLIKIPHNFSERIADKKNQLIPSYIKNAAHLIEQHYMEAISIEEVARLVKVSVRTLQKGFNTYLNQTPLSFMTSIKLDRVHQELKHTQVDQPIIDIFNAHGVRSFGHFTRLYKKRYGCTPSETVKQNKLIEINS